MNLIGQSLWQNVVAGGVILTAVIVDQLIENRRAFGGPRATAPAPAAAHAADDEHGTPHAAEGQS